MQMREPIFDIDSFARRHIGPNEEEVRAMLRDVGFDSLCALIDATVPKDIRLQGQLNLPGAKSEGEALAELRSEEHTSELQSPDHLVCRLLLEKKKTHIE